MTMINIEIDGQQFQAKPGTNVIEVADEAGIYIPRFCYHKKLTVAANCRMCLVEVERAPKPMPACATPVAEGMKVRTSSSYAVAAQKDTLEFLLINHPLDCPICDQGGECPLQDQAVGYGGHASRFIEKKRVVPDHNIGPLIQTEMTRCIHCTRCVRFGEEVAGVMELGITGRGEHLKIDTFFEQSVDSEVSGNVIDLCPVGALTSKPYRFTARSWELISHDSISPHDCLGTNIDIQTLRGEVKRVLPRENEAINECWLADRDRYSYEGILEGGRLSEPMMRTEEGMVAVDWRTALNKAADGLRSVKQQEGADALGALVSPASTLEEFYLVQKLMRLLGTSNVDHRLRQVDFSDDLNAARYPGTSIPIEEYSKAKAVLLIGSNIRKEQPLLSLRVRQAWKNGAKITAINPFDWNFNFDLTSSVVASPSSFCKELAQVVNCVDEESDDVDIHRQIANTLKNVDGKAIIVLGQSAISHPQFSKLKQLAQKLAKSTGASLSILPPANSVAGWLGGCLPHRESNGIAISEPGLNANQMIQNPRSAYLLFNVEPDNDLADGVQAVLAMESAKFVVSFQVFDEIPEYVDVALPITPFTENSGTFVNCEGRMQKATAAVEPNGQARPGWKVLRVLGNLLEVPGFMYSDLNEVLNEVSVESGFCESQQLENGDEVQFEFVDAGQGAGQFELISEMPIYAVDSIVRHAPALQATADAAIEQAHMNPDDLRTLDFDDGSRVAIQHSFGLLQMNIISDTRVPSGCIYIPAGAGNSVLPATGAMMQIRREAQL